jgi:hypothetical protein
MDVFVMRIWLKPKNTRRMTETEAAWLAGFFDGEGSLNCYVRKDKGSEGWRLAIANTNIEALEKCQILTGAGKVRTKPRYKAHYKPQWDWYVYSQRDIADILRQLLPYLVVKKALANSFLEQWVDVPK